jgi:tetratricopeptide (TPR) repeat protein
MQAAGDIIQGFRDPDALDRLEHFKDAVNRDSFAFQEVVEQLAQQTISIIRDQRIDANTKELYASYTEEQVRRLIEWKPGDARIHVFAGTYYRAVGRIDQAAAEMARARELSPQKQSIILQQGLIELARGNTEGGVDFFETAFTLDERNQEARTFYAASLIQAGRTEEAPALMDSDEARRRFALNDFLISSANQAGMTEFLIDLFETRIELNPDSGQDWATLSFLYHQNGEKEAALETLAAGSERIPEFAPLATCVADNIENDREPTEGCE